MAVTEFVRLDNRSHVLTSPMKVESVGELGIGGAGAAVASAIYKATGVRVRNYNYPITLDKLLDRLRDA